MIRKILVLVCYSLLPVVAGSQGFPQDFGGNFGQSIEEILQQVYDMETARQCIMGIDASPSEELQNDTEVAKQKLMQMCAGNKRAEAQQFAIEYTHKLAEREDVREIPACNAFATEALPRVPVNPQDGTVYGQHVCDYL